MNATIWMNRKKWIILYSIFILGVWAVILKGEIKCTENPVPTHVETNYTKLIKVTEIPLNLNEEFAQAAPTFIVGDNDGNIFAFDYRNKKIFKFDKNYRLVKTFGKQGEGTGEFGTGAGYNEVYFSTVGHIYLSDLSNKKILAFDTDGKHVKDYPLPPRGKDQLCSSVFPVITPAGDFHARSSFLCTLDAYNIHDKELKKRYSLFSKDDCRRCVVIKPRNMDANFWDKIDVGNTFYDRVRDDRLIVYMAHASTIYIFKKDKLLREFNIWPKNALDLYRRTWQAYVKDRPEERPLVIYMFRKFFIDKDHNNRFYLEVNADLDKKAMVYRFDIEGNLETVLIPPYYCRFLYKKNNLFYARARGHIAIFKEEEIQPKTPAEVKK
jgi:hypothetical protein